MKDNAARRSVKRLALARYMADLWLTRVILKLQGEPRYLLRGTCNGCGGCCETPMIHTHAVLFHLRSVRWLTLTWHRLVNGFELISENRRGYTYTFRCTHWEPETKRCDSYASRPGMCRDYPRNLLYAAYPRFLDSCGHYAVDKQADVLRESLAECDLPPEKLAELERKLHIRE